MVDFGCSSLLLSIKGPPLWLFSFFRFSPPLQTAGGTLLCLTGQSSWWAGRGAEAGALNLVILKQIGQESKHYAETPSGDVVFVDWELPYYQERHEIIPICLKARLVYTCRHLKADSEVPVRNNSQQFAISKPERDIKKQRE